MAEPQDFTENLATLKRDGFLLLPQVLDRATVEQWKGILYALYDRGAYEISNGVGNVAFEKLLALEPELSKQLLAHPSVAPYLKTILGKQCQLRSMRAHVNPADYTQEWHMDFYDYYYQEAKAEAENPARALCMNTTFYLTDNTPDRARLTFLKNYMHQPIPDELVAHMGYTEDRANPFQVWCDNQEHVNLYPMAGDVVIFYSHIPHQGAKLGPDPEGEIRANIVFHYQQNPMFPGIRFVSNPQFTLETLGYAGTFPFATG
ncbi:MAG: phytanoyl-CoA dioxygenase family protein [Caldilineaceae bacterium]